MSVLGLITERFCSYLNTLLRCTTLSQLRLWWGRLFLCSKQMGEPSCFPVSLTSKKFVEMQNWVSLLAKGLLLLFWEL